ncbi:P-loop containing nucleoside triphosphate hydrolase protein [Emericellopsis atlantica]|uniref:P-loop containing nucleoside triphosphate hydrolase protein n=1 Tax=Emericellopsis atlantica TaxID=2614577 RepID=A0A9P7ZQM3_9HYPO|nr:P-loop containing nucleoside triphosphate hydrolase protein [Emericellopsis atlantica]KAG9256042.1 P-loop containing nucleoside triphosphate hydrolase protein [Emericellopsis atlantica]
MRFNPRLRMSTLLTKPISQASAKQRAGRAGRTQPGVCYRLYNKVSFDKMEPMSEPGIRRDPLEPLVMDLASIGWTRPLSFDWLDAPNPEDLTRAAGNLVDWRFLNPEGGSSTLNGRYAVRMPLPPLWFHVILAGAEESCALDMATIGLLCEARPPIFERRDPFTQCMNLAHTAFADPLSDHIALLKAFSAYEYVLEKHSQDAAIDVEAWCSHHALSKDGLDGVHKQLKDMATFLLNAKIEPGRTLLTDTVRLRRALVKGLCTQSAIHYKGLEYRTIYENTPALVSPFSSLWEAQREWIVWTSFVSTGGNQTLEVVTAAEPEWLVDLPYFNIDRMATTHDGKLTLLQIIESLGKARRASSATNKGTRY